jgi:hypothetical protein
MSYEGAFTAVSHRINRTPPKVLQKSSAGVI